jgi:hypothetical protein
MAKVIITNVDALNGEYDIDTNAVLNGHEAHVLKQIAGVRLGELREAMERGDYDVLVAFAVISLWRNGKTNRENTLEAAELILAAPVGSVDFQAGEQDARPPEDERRNDSDANSRTSSASLKSAGDDRQETTLVSTGNPG